MNQKLAVTVLTKAGCHVTVAASGRQAIAAPVADAYDLVLMDVRMPEMDGYEAPRLFRADPNLKALPIIAMAAGAMEGDREQCLAAGMNDCLSKPIHWPTLFASLRRWLGPGPAWMRFRSRADLGYAQPPPTHRVTVRDTRPARGRRAIGLGLDRRGAGTTQSGGPRAAAIPRRRRVGVHSASRRSAACRRCRWVRRGGVRHRRVAGSGARLSSAAVLPGQVPDPYGGSV